MNLYTPLAPILCLLLALATAWLLSRRVGFSTVAGRYASVDGLRGCLALLVFVHHTSLWYVYLRTGLWQAPPSHLFNWLGNGSVAMFFMITGFLFWSKLLLGRARPVDWLGLFVSRVLRLVPLYLFVVLMMVLVVGLLTRFRLQEPLPDLLDHIGAWIGFTFAGTPNINGLINTKLVVAGVTWSLPYEWFFYWFLPLFGLALSLPVPLVWRVVGVVAIIGCCFWVPTPLDFAAFAGGIAAAYVVRHEALRGVARTRAASLFAILLIMLAVRSNSVAFHAVPLLLLSCAFIIFACGNSCFGLLTSPAARALGEISYSVYLLHGMLLFLVFQVLLGPTRALTLTPTTHWLLALLCVPVLILTGFITQRLIEAPPMRHVPGATRWLRAKAAYGRRLLLPARP